jgi:hypothetical protein
MLAQMMADQERPTIEVRAKFLRIDFQQRLVCRWRATRG